MDNIDSSGWEIFFDSLGYKSHIGAFKPGRHSSARLIRNTTHRYVWTEKTLLGTLQLEHYTSVLLNRENSPRYF